MIIMLVEKYLRKHRKLYAAFMDIKTAYNWVDGEALWYVLQVYGVRQQLMEGIKAFYREANACGKVDIELSDSFTNGVGARQGCVMSPWLFNIFMNGCMRKMKAKLGKIGTRLKMNGVDWSVPACLFAGHTALLTESEMELQGVVNQFYSVFSKKKLKVNAGSQVMVFKSKEAEVVDFGNLYRVSVPVDERYETVMRGEKMEVVNEFKNLGTVLSKHGDIKKKQLASATALSKLRENSNRRSI